jgi:hypothetical protein
MAEKMIKVRLKQRSVLEPGCRVVDPGYETEIPESQFLDSHHELLEEPLIEPEKEFEPKKDAKLSKDAP